MPRFVATLVLLALVFGTLSVEAQQAPVAPAVPEGFTLSAVEQAYLDQVLQQWETQSDKIQTFSCDFTRLVYDPVFGPANQHKNEEDGTLSYQKPDKGSFEIKEIRQWDAKEQKYLPNSQAIGEHWVCNGQAIYEYKNEQRQLVVRPIPPEMQGKSIVDGPLPFLFGAEAEKLKRRYWMKIDPRTPAGQIRLVAVPKFQADAVNYRQVELLLDQKQMLPTAMQVYMPDSSRTVYTFALGGAQVNSRMTALWNQLFSSPRTPFGWKRVVEQPQAAQTAQPNSPERR